MAAALGLGVATWSPLGGGLLTGKYRQGASGRATDLGKVVHGEDSAQKTTVLDAVLEIAKELDCPPSHVAIAWVSSKSQITILGPARCRKSKITREPWTSNFPPNIWAGSMR